MASWSCCNRHGTAPLQTIYINLDHVITVEQVREYTIVKSSINSKPYRMPCWSRPLSLPGISAVQKRGLRATQKYSAHQIKADP